MPQPTASGAWSKTAKWLSPSPRGRTSDAARLRATASMVRSSWRIIAVRATSGSASHRAVEPATSVNRNVTVPVGRSAAEIPMPGRSYC